MRRKRATATHWFGEGYTRPARTSSPDLPIAPGQTITLTSPHGGPVLIRFGSGAPDGEIVSFTFENAACHPVWRGPSDDVAFVAAVDAGLHDWAEIITDGFEVHSRMDKMQETLARGIAPSEIARLTAHNFTDLSHSLAGFTGTGITEIAEVQGWARDTGIALSEIDVVKHMNAEKALCGYGCSGYPYDAYWAFDSVGHGDLHELGHGLERRRMLFDGQELHTITNPYSYHAKYSFSQAGGTTSCQSLPYQTLFERAQAAALTDDPQAAMAAHDHDGWSWGAAINQQTMMGAQAAGMPKDGRNLLGRLHIIERAFDVAVRDDDAWADQSVALGFSGYSRSEAAELSRNDWLLIATSHALGRDASDWFRTWGHAFGETALMRVSGLPDFPVLFFPATPTGACEAFPSTGLPIDGETAWPATTSAQRTGFAQRVFVQTESDHICRYDGAH